MDETLDSRRRLPLAGAHNVRDLGGYRTRSGDITRWGRFLRASSMHLLTDDDQEALVQYGLRTVVDLRRTDETASEPNVFCRSAQVAYHHLNMIGDEGLETELSQRYAQELRAGARMEGDADRIAYTYCGWLDQRQSMLRDILQTLAAGPPAALFHCAAGKDRTGVTAALLLGLAGVPEETIVADYGLTARFSVDHYQTLPGANPAVRTWQDYQRESCPPQTMQMVLDHLAQDYGGCEGYMRAVGLGQEAIGRLRDGLLA